MNKKAVNIFNWVISVLLCSLGIALCTKASFGLSMIAAPPYILHVCLREYLPWFSQGTAEYIIEGLIIVITALSIKKFKPKFLLSFVTAVILGFCIDFWFLLLGGNGVAESLGERIILFLIGAPLISLAVAFVFRTTLPPQAYELVVTEIAKKYSFDQTRVKLANDIIMLFITFSLALLLNRSWDGVGVGTVVVTFFNAPTIKFFGKIIDKIEKTDQNNA